MPRGEPTTVRHLNSEQAARLDKPGAGAYRLTMAEVTMLRGLKESVATVESVAELGLESVASAESVASVAARLRERLQEYEWEYRQAARRQDWVVCRRVNEDREPLFLELWELEKDLPREEQYWFPNRVRNREG